MSPKPKKQHGHSIENVDFPFVFIGFSMIPVSNLSFNLRVGVVFGRHGFLFAYSWVTCWNVDGYETWIWQLRDLDLELQGLDVELRDLE